MYLIDNPTAASSLPTPGAAGTAGYFTDGNAGVGNPATILPADFMNMLMLELANVVSAAGLTLNKTTYNQVLTAIKTMIEEGGPNYGLDAGTANAYAVSYAVPITAVSDGEKLRFKALHADTGASTFTPNPGVIAPAAIWGGAHSALQGGEIIASGDVEVVWNASLNSTGAWVILESTGGALQAAPATASGHAVQLGQLLATMTGNDYLKIPVVVGGVVRTLIIQWCVSGLIPAGGSGAATFPIAFSNAALFTIAAPLGTSFNSSSGNVVAGPATLTGLTLYNWGVIAAPAKIIAIGW